MRKKYKDIVNLEENIRRMKSLTNVKMFKLLSNKEKKELEKLKKDILG